MCVCGSVCVCVWGGGCVCLRVDACMHACMCCVAAIEVRCLQKEAYRLPSHISNKLRNR